MPGPGEHDCTRLHPGLIITFVGWHEFELYPGLPIAKMAAFLIKGGVYGTKEVQEFDQNFKLIAPS